MNKKNIAVPMQLDCDLVDFSGFLNKMDCKNVDSDSGVKRHRFSSKQVRSLLVDLEDEEQGH